MANWLSKLTGRGAFVPAPAIQIQEIAEERSVLASTMDQAEIFLSKLGLGHLAGYASPRNAMGIATFYGCVKFISNQIASLPYNVYRYEKGGAVKQKGHPLNFALETRMNKNMGPMVGRRSMILNLLVHGWAIAEVKMNRLRQTRQIIPYPCHQVYIRYSELTDDYFFDIPHLGKVLSQDEVIFLKDLNFDGAVGASVINWQNQTLKINLTAKEYASKFYGAGTFMGGILTMPSMATVKTEDDAKVIKERVVGGFNDPNSYGLALLPPGSEYTPIGLSPVDSRLLEVFSMSDKDIAKMFNLSLSMIGDTEVQSSWGSGVEQMYTILTNSVLIPIAKQFEEEVNYKCFRMDEIQNGFYTKHNVKGLLRGDFKTQSEHLQRMVTSGVYTPNEARAFDDMQPLDEGGDLAYMNGTMTPLGLIPEVKTQKTNGKKDSPARTKRGESVAE